MLLARIEIIGEVDRRGAIRYDTERASTLRGGVDDDSPIDVIVADFSRTGFRFFADEQLALVPGTLVSIGLSGAGARDAKVVRRGADGSFGCAFLEPLSREAMATAFRGQHDMLASIESRLRGALEADMLSSETRGWRRWIDKVRRRLRL